MADLMMSQIIGMFLVFIGLVGFPVLVWTRSKALSLHRNGVTTDAEVISANRRSGEEGTWYRTSIRFPDEQGELVYASISLGEEYRRDDQISVVYDRTKPKRVTLTSDTPINPDGGPLALGCAWWLILPWIIAGLVLIAFPFGDPAL